MSSIIIEIAGNGKIDRYPPLKELRIKRILCQSRQKFKELQKELKQLFYKKRPGKPKLRKPTKKKNIIVKAVFNETSSANTVPDHKPSNIINLHNSELWRWRRVSEWFKELSRPDTEYAFNKKISRLIRKIGT